MRFAKFHNLTWLYEPGYRDRYIEPDEEDEYIETINDHIASNRHKYQNGDIIFIGSTYETRQEYGFHIISDCELTQTTQQYHDYYHFMHDGVYYKGVIEECDEFCQRVCGVPFCDEDFIEKLIEMGVYEPSDE